MGFSEDDLDPYARAWLALGIGPQRAAPSLHALARPVAQARLALVTTGGFVPPGGEPFRTGKLGDPSFREIPGDMASEELEICHPHYDHEPVKSDINILFPLPLARDLVAEGAIGQLANTHYSFMGYVPLTRKLETTYAPRLAERLQEEEVEAVLLTPA